MVVTATEFKKNFGKYLDAIKNEDIAIIKNGKPIAVLTEYNIEDKMASLNSLVGIAKKKR